MYLLYLASLSSRNLSPFSGGQSGNRFWAASTSLLPAIFLMKNSSSIGTPLLYPIYVCQPFGESNHITSHHSLLVKESKKHRRKQCVGNPSIPPYLEQQLLESEMVEGIRVAQRPVDVEQNRLDGNSCREGAADHAQHLNHQMFRNFYSHATRRFQKKSRNGRNSM